MKKLLFVITGLALGGAETQLVRCAERLRARGHDVQVVTLLRPRAYVEELTQAGIPVHRLGVRTKLPDPRPVVRLVRLLRAWRPHIVHSYMVHANLLSRLARPLARVPVLVCSARSLNEGGRFRELLYQLTDPLCDLTTQVSQAGVERYVRVGAVPRHKIRYVPNGVDTDVFKPSAEARRRLRLEVDIKGEFVWLAVGRLDVPKDYPTMIAAFAQVAGKHPDARLLIAGDGPLRFDLEAAVSRMDLGDRVQLLGNRRDVPDLMSAADGYAMSSAWEGMANVLLEASATGLPVVATDVGGNPEVVLDGVTGYLVPPKDPEALARAMLRIMDLSAEQRSAMSSAARNRIVAEFSLDHVVDLWEHLYRELLTKKGVPVD